MEIHIEDRQDCFTVNHALLKEFTSKSILYFTKDRVDEISIYLVSSSEIVQLHKDFFNDPSETDCISFPIDSPGTKNCFLGEIFVCTKAAVDYCAQNPSQALGKELALYTLHGILHLLGSDDIEEEDQRFMRAKEQEALALFDEEFWSSLVDQD